MHELKVHSDILIDGILLHTLEYDRDIIDLWRSRKGERSTLCTAWRWRCTSTPVKDFFLLDLSDSKGSFFAPTTTLFRQLRRSHQYPLAPRSGSYKHKVSVSSSVENNRVIGGNIPWNMVSGGSSCMSRWREVWMKFMAPSISNCSGHLSTLISDTYSFGFGTVNKTKTY